MITKGGFNLRGPSLRLLGRIGEKPLRTAEACRDGAETYSSLHFEQLIVALYEAGLIVCRPDGRWCATDLGRDALSAVATRRSARRKTPEAAA